MEERLPKLDHLGRDLLHTTPYQRLQPLAMPYLWAAGFLLLWDTPSRAASFLCVVLLFSACSTSTHDVVHGALGLSRRASEWALFFLGLPILESSHAYRWTHLEHHRLFPHHDDLEGEAAHQDLVRVLLAGPTFLLRLWLWAYAKNAKRPDQRRWLIAEALLPFLGLGVGVALLPVTSGPLALAATVLLASWFYPLFAVWLPHRHFTHSRRIPAWTVRGRILPRLFLPLAYHLEHHLYPRVPSHNLPLLAQRLDPWLRENGVRFLHVP